MWPHHLPWASPSCNKRTSSQLDSSPIFYTLSGTWHLFEPQVLWGGRNSFVLYDNSLCLLYCVAGSSQEFTTSLWPQQPGWRRQGGGRERGMGLLYPKRATSWHSIPFVFHTPLTIGCSYRHYSIASLISGVDRLEIINSATLEAQRRAAGKCCIYPDSACTERKRSGTISLVKIH